MTTILTDIEGTTSSISFVKDVLFPYARAKLPGFVREHGHAAEVRRWLDQVAIEISASACQDSVIVETLQGWIDADRKHTALKALQGMVWEAGYRDGDFTRMLPRHYASGMQRGIGWRCIPRARCRRKNYCLRTPIRAIWCRCFVLFLIPKSAANAM